MINLLSILIFDIGNTDRLSPIAQDLGSHLNRACKIMILSNSIQKHFHQII